MYIVGIMYLLYYFILCDLLIVYLVNKYDVNIFLLVEVYLCLIKWMSYCVYMRYVFNKWWDLMVCC